MREHRPRRDGRRAAAIGALLASWAVTAIAADAVVPGTSRVDATFVHLSVHWTLVGDDDGDSTFTLEFRKTGELAWRQGAPPMRARPGLIVDGAPLQLNTWAASALFLESGVTYDLRLTLFDPGGGGEVRELSGTTRTEPVASPTGRRLQVAPGNGGGDGTAGDPFSGLQAAADEPLGGTVARGT